MSVLDLVIVGLAFTLGVLPFWGYIGYPLFLQFVTKNQPKPWYWDKKRANPNNLPSVSLIIPTYNEEKVIGKKIENILKLEYPKNKIEFLVVDSNSTDKTREIVSKFPRIKLILQSEAKGKLSAINHAMKFAKNDVIIINDANTILEKDALVHLCKPFMDKSIGCVGARYIAISDHTSGLLSHETDYREREHRLWELETLFDSCFVCGELFAFRKKIVQKLNEDTMGDDLDVCLQVRKRGYKVVFQPQSTVYEKVPQNLKDFKLQKIRRTIVTLRALRYLKSINWKYKFIFFSHKFIPVLSPFLIILLLFSLFYINFYLGLVITGIYICLLLLSKEMRYITYMMYVTLLAWINCFTIGNKWLRAESSR